MASPGRPFEEIRRIAHGQIRDREIMTRDADGCPTGEKETSYDVRGHLTTAKEWVS